MRFSSDDTARLRRGLMKRGRDLAELLSQVLAGKRPPSLASLLAARPGMRPEEVDICMELATEDLAGNSIFRNLTATEAK